MAKKKICIYKCESDGICARSTSKYHCQKVTDAICNECLLQQDKTIVSDKVLLKKAISKALEVLPMTESNQPTVDILTDALKL